MRPLPKTPPKTPRARDAAGRPKIVNADVPSETVGLPGVGEGASAAHFARDTVGHQAGEDATGTGEGGSSSDAREPGA